MKTINEQIEEQANKASTRKVADFAPYSYKAGFIDGAIWMLNELKQQSV